MILREATSLLEHSGHETSNVGLTPTLNNDACNFVFLKKDRIYHHKLSRFHFTTYDVRRGTDIINPGTSHCNIMLLADNVDCKDGFSSSHHFLYARVLGVYHANVIYTGPGMRDYETRRLDFLWVRWYEIVDPKSSGWSTSTLDSVCFPPLHGDDAFGFVDPKDVLRGCHIMPNFAKGKRQADGIGISRCAKDSQDYNRYYIGRRVLLSLADPDVNCIPRFSERDILMRYHWGLGVGHIHAHEHAAASVCIPEVDIQLPKCEAENRPDNVSTQTQENNDNYDSDDPELGLEDRDLEGWEDVEADDSEGEGEDENVEEEDFAGM